MFTALLLEENTSYVLQVLWRCALACERLRCEPWRPWGFSHPPRLSRILLRQPPRGSGYTNPRYPTRPKDIHLENLENLLRRRRQS